MNRVVTPKEHLIACLRTLAQKHAVEEIAAEIDASPESLKQVLAGTLLPSGQPRGIGPSIQRKLDASYPGWSRLPVPGGPKVPASDLEAAVHVIAAALREARSSTRKAVGSLLAALAEAPEEADHVAEQMQALLQIRKLPRAA